jgi:hypothetical protein
MRTASVGEVMVGLTATRNFSRRVKAVTLDATTHASSQRLPVGSRTPSRGSDLRFDGNCVPGLCNRLDRFRPIGLPVIEAHDT